MSNFIIRVELNLLCIGHLTVGSNVFVGNMVQRLLIPHHSIINRLIFWNIKLLNVFQNFIGKFVVLGF